mmetsp:Transcript_44671/g.100890  ORF Transcript_44671/g.100890 Transcript_44671/m.100890 type:complete len:222 (-) Transcript_44671:153-818(-)
MTTAQPRKRRPDPRSRARGPSRPWGGQLFQPHRMPPSNCPRRGSVSSATFVMLCLPAGYSLLLCIVCGRREHELLQRHLARRRERDLGAQFLLKVARVAAVPPLDELRLGDAPVAVGVDLHELGVQVGLCLEREAELLCGGFELLLIDVARAVGVDREEDLVQVGEGRRAQVGLRLVGNRAAEIANVLVGGLDLPLLLGFGPFEVRGHQLRHAGDRALCRL